jgi:hypothetical protein
MIFRFKTENKDTICHKNTNEIGQNVRNFKLTTGVHPFLQQLDHDSKHCTAHDHIQPQKTIPGFQLEETPEHQEAEHNVTHQMTQFVNFNQALPGKFWYK